MEACTKGKVISTNRLWWLKLFLFLYKILDKNFVYAIIQTY